MSPRMANRMTDAAHRPDVPKAQRGDLKRGGYQRPLVNPLKTLGHPARPRRGRKNAPTHDTAASQARVAAHKAARSLP